MTDTGTEALWRLLDERAEEMAAGLRKELGHANARLVELASENLDLRATNAALASQCARLRQRLAGTL